MLSFLSIIATAAAANNAFSSPISNVTIEAGSSYQLKWIDVSGSTANLVLRTGDANDLSTVQTIASNINNQGSYNWQVPDNLPTGSYSVEIIADGVENYSSFFTIKGNGKAVSSSAVASSSAQKSSAVASSSAAHSSAVHSSAAGSSAAHSSAAGSSAASRSAPHSSAAGTSSKAGSSHASTSGASSSGSAANSSSSSSTSSSKVDKSNGVIATISKVAVIGAVGVGATMLL